MNKRLHNRNTSYLFGPVPSRRLGISLGVDLVPYKTCTMDCIYCESGCTTNLTLERREFYPTDSIISELDDYLSHSPKLDFITFSGAGEPTLHSGIGDIITFIKTQYPKYKLSLLTNGMLLQDDDVFNEVKGVDMIVPSLDAPDIEIYKIINRPVGDIDFDAIIDSYIRFHKESDAIFILEIFIIPDINDSDESLSGFLKLAKKINPDKIQLNSLDRPGAESFVTKMTDKGLERIQKFLAEVGDVEIIGKYKKQKNKSGRNNKGEHKNLDVSILDLLSRRPCTVEDICTSLGFSVNTIEKVLNRLQKKGLLITEKSQRGVFFKCV